MIDSNPHREFQRMIPARNAPRKRLAPIGPRRALIGLLAVLFTVAACAEVEVRRGTWGAFGGAAVGGILGGGRGAAAGAIAGGLLGAATAPPPASYSYGYYPRPVPPAYYAYYPY